MQKMRKAGKNPDLRIFSRTIMFFILFLHKKSVYRICNRIYAYVPHVVSLLYTVLFRFSKVFFTADPPPFPFFCALPQNICALVHQISAFAKFSLHFADIRV